MSLMTYVQYVVVENGEENMRLDRWFKKHYPPSNFVKRQRILRSGQVRVDKKRVKFNNLLQYDFFLITNWQYILFCFSEFPRLMTNIFSESCASGKIP